MTYLGLNLTALGLSPFPRTGGKDGDAPFRGALRRQYAYYLLRCR